jgi:hypothetical protein
MVGFPDEANLRVVTGMLQLVDQRKEVVLLNHMLIGTLEVRGR